MPGMGGTDVGGMELGGIPGVGMFACPIIFPLPTPGAGPGSGISSFIFLAAGPSPPSENQNDQFISQTWLSHTFTRNEFPNCLNSSIVTNAIRLV